MPESKLLSQTTPTSGLPLRFDPFKEESLEAPRSYVVATPLGQVHRNRSHMNAIPECPETEIVIPVVVVPPVL